MVTNHDRDRQPTAASKPGERPTALPVLADGIPSELRDGKRFVVWRYELRDGKWTKPPYRPDGRPADSTNPSTWSTFDEVMAAYEAGGWDGIGRVHLPDDHLVGGDADECRDAATGKVTGESANAVMALDTYTEVSPSGRGLRAYCHANKPGPNCKRGNFELYNGRTRKGKPGGRYLTLTGHHVEGTPRNVEDRQPQLEAVYHQLLADKPTNGKATRKPAEPLADDDELIRRIEGSKQAAKFRRLMAGDISAYGDDDSDADEALCCVLAFWTRDPAQIDRIVRRSGLNREKWNRADYRDRTIARALELVTETYRPRRRVRIDRLSTNGDGAGTDPGHDGNGDDDGRLSAADVIRRYWSDRFKPTFRRGTTIYSSAENREVRRSEIVAGAPSDLIGLLKDTEEGIKYDRDEMPKLFRLWAPTAFEDLIRPLPEEEQAEELVPGAEHEFRARVKAGLLRMVPLGHTYREKGEERTEIQRRPLIDWCRIFAKPGRWGDVRGHRVWSRKDNDRLRVALRPEVFQQLLADREIGLMDFRRFAKLAAVYQIADGDTGKVAGGTVRVVELAPAFIAELLAGPGPDPAAPANGDTAGDGHGDAWEGD